MTQKQLNDIMTSHKEWLYNGVGNRADLSYADLRYADLNRADLSYANLSYANLSYADLRYADLSGAKGLLNPIEYLNAYFEKTADGYIAYKTFSSQYEPPARWTIQPGSIITENVNFNRCTECACGINVAPRVHAV